MRRTLTICFGAGVTVALAAVTPTSTRAHGYRWCVDGSGGMGGSTNCGFESYEQCMLTARGSNGRCYRNPWYVVPREEPAQIGPAEKPAAKKRSG